MGVNLGEEADVHVNDGDREAPQRELAFEVEEALLVLLFGEEFDLPRHRQLALDRDVALLVYGDLGLPLQTLEQFHVEHAAAADESGLRHDDLDLASHLRALVLGLAFARMLVVLILVFQVAGDFRKVEVEARVEGEILLAHRHVKLRLFDAGNLVAAEDDVD